MIHQIKILQSQGLTKRAIAQQLKIIGSEERLAPSAHRTVRTGPYTAPHVKRTSRLS